MRTTSTILLSALLMVGSVCGADTKSATVLFARADYRFSVTSCEARRTDTDKKKITLTISYEVPKDSRFLLYVSQSQGEPWVDSLYSQELRTRPAGEVTAEFECGREPPAFCVGLWRGVGGGSPSGILCDGAIVSLPLTITPVFGKEDGSPSLEGCVRPERSGAVNSTGVEQARGGPKTKGQSTKD